MSTYQLVARSTATVFHRIDFGALYEAFCSWWVSLYAKPPRRLPPLI